MITCPNCKKEVPEQLLWIQNWPFNFAHLDCPYCEIVSLEDTLWDKLFGFMMAVKPWAAIDGGSWVLHREPHRWWQVG